MRPVVLALVAGIAACGSSQKPAAEEPKISSKPTTRTIVEDDSEPTEGVTVVNQRGRMNVSDIEKGLAPHTQSLTDCYMSRVGKRRWLGGQVEIHWDISKDGEITAVKLASSDLGAWPIEKCVLGVAKAISFGAPRGNKPARVTAPLSFSAGTGAVRWDEEAAAKAIGGRLVKLAPCASREPAPTDVTITIYLGTRGKVETVGFASPRGFGEAWADCAEKTILAWSLTDPRGKVAKLSITFNPSGDDDRDL